jgi:tetratricopeptide (TPR) repeat protein
MAVYRQMLDEAQTPERKTTSAQILLNKYLQQKKYDEAVALFNRLKEDPLLKENRLPLALYNSVIPALMRSGKRAEALVLMDELQAAIPGPNPADTVYQQLVFYQGEMLVREGQLQKAEEKMLPIIYVVRSPDRLLNQFMDLAEAYAQKGEFDNALTLLGKLTPLQKENRFSQGRLMFAQADILLSMGREQEGIEKLQMLEKLFQDDPYRSNGVSYYLGRYYERTNQPEKARMAYQRMMGQRSAFSDVAQQRLQLLSAPSGEGFTLPD